MFSALLGCVCMFYIIKLSRALSTIGLLSSSPSSPISGYLPVTSLSNVLSLQFYLPASLNSSLTRQFLASFSPWPVLLKLIFLFDICCFPYINIWENALVKVFLFRHNLRSPLKIISLANISHVRAHLKILYHILLVLRFVEEKTLLKDLMSLSYYIPFSFKDRCHVFS